MDLKCICGATRLKNSEYCSWGCLVLDVGEKAALIPKRSDFDTGGITSEGVLIDDKGETLPVKFAVTIFPCQREIVSPLDHEIHYLLYSNGKVALTVHDGCHALFELKTGMLLFGEVWIRGYWKLLEEDRIKILRDPRS